MAALVVGIFHDRLTVIIEDEDTNVPQNGVEGCQKNGARHSLPLPMTAQKVASESQAAARQTKLCSRSWPKRYGTGRRQGR